MSNKYVELTKALEKAKQAAQVFINTEDGGTCNFDAPAIDYRAMGMRKDKAEEAINAARLHCYEWNSWGGKKLVISGIASGQGNRRTRMAEAACRSLQADGIAATMYYQVD